MGRVLLGHHRETEYTITIDPIWNNLFIKLRTQKYEQAKGDVHSVRGRLIRMGWVDASLWKYPQPLDFGKDLLLILEIFFNI